METESCLLRRESAELDIFLHLRVTISDALVGVTDPETQQILWHSLLAKVSQPIRSDLRAFALEMDFRQRLLLLCLCKLLLKLTDFVVQPSILWFVRQGFALAAAVNPGLGRENSVLS